MNIGFETSFFSSVWAGLASLSLKLSLYSLSLYYLSLLYPPSLLNSLYSGLSVRGPTALEPKAPVVDMSFLLRTGSSDLVPSSSWVTLPISGKSSLIFWAFDFFWNAFGGPLNLMSISPGFEAPLGWPTAGPDYYDFWLPLPMNGVLSLLLGVSRTFHPFAESCSCSSCFRFCASTSLRSLITVAVYPPSVMSVFSSSLDS